MEKKHDHIRLTSGEMAVLWGTYINDTLGICTISYFLNYAKDPDVRSVLEYALGLSKKHIETIKQIFQTEKFPIPMGFSNDDVNINAGKLYSESFMLYYIQNMGSMGVNSYSLALPNSVRKDIREFFMKCLSSSSELYDRTCAVLLEKGILIRCPSIPYPSQAEFVQKKSYLGGWYGDQRPLTSIEISFLYLNFYRNNLGNALLTGFSQVANSKQVRHYLYRGAEIAKHHSLVFSKFLSDSNLETPMSWDIMPFDLREPPFSDYLMMYHTTALNNSGIGFYGASIGGSFRKDLSAAYGRLITEVGEFSLVGAKIMIENDWLEKPPTAVDRKGLALD
jgi:hypothetical protein